ncbi:MAG: protoheme IX farnesyltransferase [Rhizobiales bacterium]|nr:protoheme IX farnesyltransferase [Hyphomicrobiales bacterium]
MSDISARTLDSAAAASGGGSLEDYIALLKPRVMYLAVLTALAGLLAAPGGIHPWLGFMAIFAISIGAGACGALNMWYDADIDGVMKRTSKRPVPNGAIAPGEALGFGIVLAGASVVMLGLFVNWAAAGLLAFTIFFYAVIYTMWLKRWTAQNIVIGGAAGAVPPMIGWAAVTGGVDLGSIVLFLIIFMWTPPHFWALALFRREDYADARVPMLPVVAGTDETRRQIWLYSLLLAPLALAPSLIGLTGLMYASVAAIMGLEFLRAAWRVYTIREGEAADRACKKLFGFSIVYLFALFGVVIVEKALGYPSLPSVLG